MKKKSIHSYIHLFRTHLVNSLLKRNLVCLIIGINISLLLIGMLESIFYFSVTIRMKIVEFYIITLFLSIFFIILKWSLHYFALFNNSSNESLALLLKEREPFLSDRLLNTLQLEKSLSDISSGKDLAEFAIDKMIIDLNSLSKESLNDPIPNFLKKLLFSIPILTTIIMFIFNDSLPHAFIRLAYPAHNFPVPKPFTLKSLLGNQQVLGGDTLRISIAGYGDLPDAISLYWEDIEQSNTIPIHHENEIYNYDFNGIKRNIRFWAEYKSKSLFSPWDAITTSPDTIFVVDRPVVHELGFTIIPPEYTQESIFHHPPNITDISMPEGSNIRISGRASKPLKSAWIIMEENLYNLSIINNNIEGTILINDNNTFSIHIKDHNGVNNLHPPNYRLHIIKDSPPDLIIQNPPKKFELDELDFIGFDIQASDDYGFSNAWIEYHIKAPDYLPQDTVWHRRNIFEIQKNSKSQKFYHEWNLSDFVLAPDDELHIHVFIADNNILSGPLFTKSPLLIGQYPSIEDLFNRLEEDETKVENYNDGIQINLDDIHDLVEELELELLKSEDVSWEQEQKVSETLEKMEEVFTQIEKIQNTMQTIQEQAEKNNLVSDELVEKFSHFQELLDDIMTPELLETMEKLQDAMKDLDPQKLLDALENFEFDLEAFEEQLERYIDMFEMALAEQKMDEVVKRLEKLVEEQISIVDELTENKNQDLAELASRERRQEEYFKALKQAMNEATKAMENLSLNASQQLDDLVESELAQNTESELKNARAAMQNNNKSHASQSAAQAQGTLQEMLEISENIQSDFQEDTVDEMLRKFLALIHNLLYISQAQEKLINETKGLRSRSPKLLELAVYQDQILRENKQFMSQLTELSKQTFHISPAIASAIGKTKTAMDRTIARLEQKQTSSAKLEMKNILMGLNEIAYLLLEAANQMQMSGSGSGFSQLMEKLEQMSQAQEGINQGTMQLPQMGMMAQQQMMEQLQKQQEKLKQQLEELLSENPGEKSGGLSKANNDMEEVIDDFRKRQVDRRTQERQQRILSRMLDSQKSLTQKDFSEKRKSTQSDEFIYSGPTGLPSDFGERNMLLINAMESALKEGHSREYQNMLKQYFKNLQKQENKTYE